MTSLFFSGLDALHEIEKEKARRQSEQAANKFLNFYLQDGDQKLARMFLPQPIIYWAHVFYVGNKQDKYVCTDHVNGCPLCKCKPLNSRPTQRGFMPVRWMDAPEYNEKPQDDRLFLWDMNYPPLIAFAQAVAVLKGGKDITSAPYIITRAVSGNNSVYGFHRQDPEPFSELDQKVIAEIPKWEEIIIAPTQEQYDWILSNKAGYFPTPKQGAAKKPAAGVPKPSYDRKAEAAAQPAPQATYQAPQESEAPPFEPDESPVRPASDFV